MDISKRNHKRVIGGLRVTFALITLVALAVQIVVSVRDRGASLLNLLSFFTIESNVIAATILSIGGVILLRSTREPGKLGMWRGASTVYMTTTGIVYAVLLSGNEAAVDSTIAWVNLTLHYIMPCVLILDWILLPSILRASYSSVLARWLAFPFSYLMYSLVRGVWTGWYPYPFLSPSSAGGYAMVIFTAIGITIFVGIVGVVVIWYTRSRNHGLHKRHI